MSILLRISDGSRIQEGSRFYRYLRDATNTTYDKGDVFKVENGWCDVDFGDTLVRYAVSEITYMYNTILDSEHYTSLSKGVLLEAYQSAPRLRPNLDNDPVLASFEELLKRI